MRHVDVKRIKILSDYKAKTCSDVIGHSRVEQNIIVGFIFCRGFTSGGNEFKLNVTATRVSSATKLLNRPVIQIKLMGRSLYEGFHKQNSQLHVMVHGMGASTGNRNANPSLYE